MATQSNTDKREQTIKRIAALLQTLSAEELSKAEKIVDDILAEEKAKREAA